MVILYESRMMQEKQFRVRFFFSKAKWKPSSSRLWEAGYVIFVLRFQF